jgi:hypothetical protein
MIPGFNPVNPQEKYIDKAMNIKEQAATEAPSTTNLHENSYGTVQPSNRTKSIEASPTRSNQGINNMDFQYNIINFHSNIRVIRI